VETAKEFRDLTAASAQIGPGWEQRDARAGIQLNILSGNFDAGPVIETEPLTRVDVKELP
jgi:hypothetical protein